VDIAVSGAKAQLTELVRRAEAGEEVVLTRHGKQVARLVGLVVPEAAEERRARIHAGCEAARVAAAKTLTPGPSATRSQDFLYDEDGLPL
jgi:prevent-host-death family protein